MNVLYLFLLKRLMNKIPNKSMRNNVLELKAFIDSTTRLNKNTCQATKAVQRVVDHVFIVPSHCEQFLVPSTYHPPFTLIIP